MTRTPRGTRLVPRCRSGSPPARTSWPRSGLNADRVLGPLCTPERGREPLTTPRAGEPGEAPPLTADLDPPGLAWLTGKRSGQLPDDVSLDPLRKGASPELPARIGDDTVVLNEPMSLWDARFRLRDNRETSTWDDKALAAVGRASSGWSFVFETRPSRHFHERRFASPAVPASRGTRAVVILSEPGRQPDASALFHLSVAEDGGERYAFTVQGTMIRRNGPIPASLNPGRFFTKDASTDAERVDP